MNTFAPKTTIIASLILGSFVLGQPVLAGQYDKAMSGCHTAIQTELSIPADAYKHKLTHIKSKARTVELWYDISSREVEDSYTAHCKARKTSGEVTSLVTNTATN